MRAPVRARTVRDPVWQNIDLDPAAAAIRFQADDPGDSELKIAQFEHVTHGHIEPGTQAWVDPDLAPGGNAFSNPGGPEYDLGYLHLATQRVGLGNRLDLNQQGIFPGEAHAGKRDRSRRFQPAQARFLAPVQRRYIPRLHHQVGGQQLIGAGHEGLVDPLGESSNRRQRRGRDCQRGRQCAQFTGAPLAPRLPP